MDMRHTQEQHDWDSRTKVTVTLSVRQIRTLVSLLRAKAKKVNARHDINFVPEEGKRDANVLAVRRLTTLAKKLESLIPERVGVGGDHSL
jgi:hypothetical protein